MDRRINNASVTGNTTSLLELLEEDELLLNRFLAADVPENPLHIAALCGHSEFATEILRRRPELANELNWQGFSPLHLASANGHVGMVKLLISFVPDAISRLDGEDRTPLHAAAIKGRVEVIEELVRHKPESVEVVTSREETVLHLCMKHHQMEALKMIVGFITDADAAAEFVNRKDVNGNTILHLSASKKHFSMIRFLLETTSVQVNTTNMNGLTALDVLALCPNELGDMEIAEILLRNGAKRSYELSSHLQHHLNRSMTSQEHSQLVPEDSDPISGLKLLLGQQIEEMRSFKQQWLQEQGHKHKNDRKNIMVVIAILIMTLTFQATLTPPGGLWQDDSISLSNATLANNVSNSTILPNKGGVGEEEKHTAGTPILNNKNPLNFITLFWFFNGVGFVSGFGILIMCFSRNDPKFSWTLEVFFGTGVCAIAEVSVLASFIIGDKRSIAANLAYECGVSLVLAVLSIEIVGDIYGRFNLRQVASRWGQWMEDFQVRYR